VNTLHDYNLLTEFTAVGSGSARWCFAEKDGEEFFIKEFLSPVYPSEERKMDAAHREKLIGICNRFWSRKERLYEALRRLNNGNIVTIDDFFLDNTKFYSVCRKIEGADISCDQVYTLPSESRLIIMRALVHCLKKLDQEHIVHADMKPDNVMIKRTDSGFYTIKLIDFDNSFFEDDLPEDAEQIGGDPVYLAPETMLLMSGEDCAIDHKIDIFALGIMFHQFWTGLLPQIESEEEWYIHEGVLEGDRLILNNEIPTILSDLIKRMLTLKAEVRPDYGEIFAALNELSGRRGETAESPQTKKRRFLRPCGNL